MLKYSTVKCSPHSMVGFSFLWPAATANDKRNTDPSLYSILTPFPRNSSYIHPRLYIWLAERIGNGNTIKRFPLKGWLDGFFWATSQTIEEIILLGTWIFGYSFGCTYPQRLHPKTGRQVRWCGANNGFSDLSRKEQIPHGNCLLDQFTHRMHGFGPIFAFATSPGQQKSENGYYSSGLVLLWQYGH